MLVLNKRSDYLNWLSDFLKSVFRKFSFKIFCTILDVELVVSGGDSSSIGCEFESWHRIHNFLHFLHDCVID